MQDNKHIKKKHLGLFAANLVEPSPCVTPPDNRSPCRNQLCLDLDFAENTTPTVMLSGMLILETIMPSVNNVNLSSRHLTTCNSHYYNNHHLPLLLGGICLLVQTTVTIPQWK